MKSAIIVVSLLSFLASPAPAQETPNTPALPAVTPDPTYPATIQTVLRVCAAAVGNPCTSAGGNSDYQETGNGNGLNQAIQDAITNQGTLGNTGAIEIRIDAADFNRSTGTKILRAGSAFVVNGCNGAVEETDQQQTRGIIIRTSSSSLPANPTPSSVTRIKLATHQSLMPAIETSGNNVPVFRIGVPHSGTGAVACNIRLMGLDVQKPSGSTGGTLVEIGDGSTSGTQNTAAEAPYGIWIDRSFVFCPAGLSCTKGVMLQAKGGIVGSIVTGMKDTSGDSNAFGGWNTPGPVLARNNEFSSAGESVLFGGAALPTGANYNPSDMTFTENTIHMEPTCPGSWACKNLFELKTGVRVLIEGNLLYYSRQDAQNGQAFNVKSSNSGNSNTFAWTRDVTIRFNVIRDLDGELISIQGWNGVFISNLTRLVRVHDNLADGASNGIQTIAPAGSIGGGGCFGVAGCAAGDEGKIQDFSFDNNTVGASARSHASLRGGFPWIDSNVNSGGNDRCNVRHLVANSVLPLQREGATGSIMDQNCKIAGARDDTKAWSGNVLSPADSLSWFTNLLTNATAAACDTGTGFPLQQKTYSFNSVACVPTQGSQFTTFSAANIGTGLNDYTLLGSSPGKGASYNAAARTAAGLSTDVGADIARVNSETCVARNGGDPSLCSGAPAPTVTSSTPNTGSFAGGTAITNLAGTNFQSGATVSYGGVAASNVVVVSATQITCTTPAHASGAVDIVVSNPDLQSGTCVGCFTYTGSGAPAISQIAPSAGTQYGGTAITITGTNFASGATVTIGGQTASGIAVVNDTTITAFTPLSSSIGAKNVTVINPDAQQATLTNGFTYTQAAVPLMEVVYRAGAPPMLEISNPDPVNHPFCASSTANDCIFEARIFANGAPVIAVPASLFAAAAASIPMPGIPRYGDVIYTARFAARSPSGVVIESRDSQPAPVRKKPIEPVIKTL